MTFYLTVEQLIRAAEIALAPAQPVVRDLGLLQSAAARPQTQVFGIDPYPSLPEKAAALMESLARNHPLIDGNKRLAWLATVGFMLANGVDVTPPNDDEAETFVLAVAQGHLELQMIAATLTAWSHSAGQ